MGKTKNNVMNFMNPERRTRLLLLAALFAVSMVIFRDYLFGEELMVFNDIGEDTMQLYTMQFAGVVNHIREGNRSFWDFTNGFGMNLFNLNLFDPSLMLLFVLGVLFGPAKMLFFLSWIQVLKIMAAGWVFYHYLSCFSGSRQAKFAAAFAYGLNGYLLVWGQHYQFGMAVVYFPLMLYGCEKFLRGKKGRVVLPLAVFLSGIYSAYFSYMSLAALGVYLLFRVNMEDGDTFRERIGRFFGGCGQILLGLFMSMVFFLPLMNTLLHVSSRVGNGETGGIGNIAAYMGTFPGKFYETLVMRIFSSNLQNAMGLTDGRFEAFWNYYEDPVLFCGTLAVILDVAFLTVFWKTKASRRKKTAVYLGAGLIGISLLFEIVPFVWNGFSGISHRFTYVLMPFFLLAMAWMWDYIKESGKISVVLLGAVGILMTAVYYIGYDQSVFREYKWNALVLGTTGLLMIVCLVFRMKAQNPKLQRGIMAFLVALLMINMASDGAACYENRISLRKSDTPAEQIEEMQRKYEEGRDSGDSVRSAYASLAIPQGYFGALYNPNIQAALAYLKEKDGEFYRLEKDFISATDAMDAQGQGYYGISSYNSVMNKNIREFADTCCPELYYKDENHMSFRESREDNHLASFLGIRYLLSRDGELDREKYKKLEQFGDIYLYENVLETNMADFYENVISEESLRRLCTEETRNLLLENALAAAGGREIADVKELNPAETGSRVRLNAPVNDSHVTGTVDAVSPGYICFKIPYEDGWSLTIDGKETELFRGNLGFLACRVPEGKHEIELRFRAPGLKTGAAVSVIFWVLFAAQQICMMKKQKNTED